MQQKTWTMREGFALGAALVGVGLMLEWFAGPVRWTAFAWPVNIAVLGAFVGLVVVMYFLGRSVRLFRFLGTLQAAIPALVCAVGLTIVMGLTRQDSEGHGLHNMLTFWPFVLVYAYIAVILGLVVLKHLTHPRQAHLSTLCFHLGMLVVLLTATLGNADLRRMKVICTLGQPEWRALDDERRVVEVPLAIELKRFIMETYDDGSPRRYASEVMIYTRTGKAVHAIVDVNKPIRVEGWKIYQYGYDTQRGAESEMSILELVRDPWQPYVYVGIGLMLLGALLMLTERRKEKVES